jgi:hypothetical protein
MVIQTVDVKLLVIGSVLIVVSKLRRIIAAMMNEPGYKKLVKEGNVEAAALALGMELMASSSAESHNIMTQLYESLEEENKRLRREVSYWKALGLRYLEIRSALLDRIESDYA